MGAREREKKKNDGFIVLKTLSWNEGDEVHEEAYSKSTYLPLLSLLGHLLPPPSPSLLGDFFPFPLFFRLGASSSLLSFILGASLPLPIHFSLWSLSNFLS